MSFKLQKLFLCLLAILGIYGCTGFAIVPEEDPLKKDMNSLRRDMAMQQQRLISLEETVKKGAELPSKRIDSIEETWQKEKANINASMDKIREEMAFLNGRLGEIEVSVKRVNEDASAMNEKIADKRELDNRLSSLQNQIAMMKKGLSSLDEKVTALEHAKAATDKNIQGQASVSVETPRQEAKAPRPEELYDEAIKFTKDKDYQNALERFRRFLSSFHGHDLASNAQYWIGEIYYAQKEYERAILEFNEVVKVYPKSKKVSAALLKQGMAFYELGHKKEARLILEKVIDKYPKTEEAGMAKKMIKGMR